MTAMEPFMYGHRESWVARRTMNGWTSECIQVEAPPPRALIGLECSKMETLPLLPTTLNAKGLSRLHFFLSGQKV